jgi:hypothetical protein
MKCIADSIDDDSGTASSQSNLKGHNTYLNWSYLVESSGRLLLVRRLVEVPSACDRAKQRRTISFDLFEADLTTTNSCGPWRRVNTLDGQALFVGTHSKSLPASECGAREDCIYFMRDYDRGYYDDEPFRDSGSFNVRNGMITPLLETTVDGLAQGETDYKGARPTWFFPSEAV